MQDLITTVVKFRENTLKKLKIRTKKKKNEWNLTNHGQEKTPINQIKRNSLKKYKDTGKDNIIMIKL